MSEIFPFHRGDRIQHVSGDPHPVFIIRGVDDDAWEAWAELEGGGGGTRILNPRNWKRVATDPRDRTMTATPDTVDQAMTVSAERRRCAKIALDEYKKWKADDHIGGMGAAANIYAAITGVMGDIDNFLAEIEAYAETERRRVTHG